MRRTVIYLGIFLLIIGLISCNIEKRLYRPGFFVDVNSLNKKTQSNEKLAYLKESKEVKSNYSNSNLNLNDEDNLFVFHENTTNPDKYATLNLIAQATERISNNNIVTVNNTLPKAEVLKVLQNKNQNKLLLVSKKLSGGGKNQIVALLLCFFLGMLGVHSFYLGNNQKGIIQLVMFLVGLVTSLFIIGYVILLALGIWVFVDFIRLIIGDLGPGW